MTSRKFILLSILVMIFSGCVTTKIPAKSEYRINTHVIAKKSNGQSCKEKSLKVAQAFSSSSLMSNSMMYALGDSKQYAYSESLWAQSPNTTISSKFLKLIRETQLFKSVQISKSRSRNDFILEINIEDFMQYFDEKSTYSYVKIAVNVALIDIKSNKVVDAQTFSSQIYVEMLNAEGGVKGLSNALSNVLKDTNVWISGVCK